MFLSSTLEASEFMGKNYSEILRSVKVLSGIKSSKNWNLKAAVSGTRNASKHWQEFSCDKLVTSMLFQEKDINPCIYITSGFATNWTWNSAATIFWCVDCHPIRNFWQMI